MPEENGASSNSSSSLLIKGPLELLGGNGENGTKNAVFEKNTPVTSEHSEDKY